MCLLSEIQYMKWFVCLLKINCEVSEFSLTWFECMTTHFVYIKAIVWKLRSLNDKTVLIAVRWPQCHDLAALKGFIPCSLEAVKLVFLSADVILMLRFWWHWHIITTRMWHDVHKKMSEWMNNLIFLIIFPILIELNALTMQKSAMRNKPVKY